MTNPTIEVDIAEILKDIQSKQSKILEEVKEVKIGQARLEGRIDTLDEKLSGQIKTLDAKIEQIDKRVANQEFINRGVLIGLILALLGGAAKIFGFGVNL